MKTATEIIRALVRELLNGRGPMPFGMPSEAYLDALNYLERVENGTEPTVETMRAERDKWHADAMHHEGLLADVADAVRHTLELLARVDKVLDGRQSPAPAVALTIDPSTVPAEVLDALRKVDGVALRLKVEPAVSTLTPEQQHAHEAVALLRETVSRVGYLSSDDERAKSKIYELLARIDRTEGYARVNL